MPAKNSSTAKSRAQRTARKAPLLCVHCSLRAVSTSCNKLDFLVKGALHDSSYKITRLGIFFQLLKGALVSLLTCPRRRLAVLSLPLCGLLWEFPALLLLRRLFKGSMNNLALTKSGLKQVKTGPYTFTDSFRFLQAQGKKKEYLKCRHLKSKLLYFFQYSLPFSTMQRKQFIPSVFKCSL